MLLAAFYRWRKKVQKSAWTSWGRPGDACASADLWLLMRWMFVGAFSAWESPEKLRQDARECERASIHWGEWTLMAFILPVRAHLSRENMRGEGLQVCAELEKMAEAWSFYVQHNKIKREWADERLSGRCFKRLMTHPPFFPFTLPWHPFPPPISNWASVPLILNSYQISSKQLQQFGTGWTDFFVSVFISFCVWKVLWDLLKREV